MKTFKNIKTVYDPSLSGTVYSILLFLLTECWLLAWHMAAEKENKKDEIPQPSLKLDGATWLSSGQGHVSGRVPRNFQEDCLKAADSNESPLFCFSSSRCPTSRWTTRMKALCNGKEGPLPEPSGGEHNPVNPLILDFCLQIYKTTNLCYLKTKLKKTLPAMVG